MIGMISHPLMAGAMKSSERGLRLLLAVRPEGANHQWRKTPPRELSIDLEADERLGRVSGWAGVRKERSPGSLMRKSDDARPIGLQTFDGLRHQSEQRPSR